MGILEDDCLPLQRFFWYCRELLLRYKDDTRIWQISGFNMQDGKHRPNDHYFFSHFGFLWGWASWRRTGTTSDIEMKLWPLAKEENIINTTHSCHRGMPPGKRPTMKKLTHGNYQWYFVMASSSALSIVPPCSMIKGHWLWSGCNTYF